MTRPAEDRWGGGVPELRSRAGNGAKPQAAGEASRLVICRACAGVALAWSVTVGALSPPPPADAPVTIQTAAAKQPHARPSKWHDEPAAAFAEALRENRPVLVVVGEDGCKPCAALDAELAKPEAAEALAKWTLVRIDAARSPEAAAGLLQGGTLPVVRLMAASGRRVAVTEAAMPAADLAKWLEEHHAAATATAGDELLDPAPPDGPAVASLVKHLGGADAGPREAAIRRVLAHPKQTAGVVVEAIAKGDLGTRLSCLEVLTAWRAPVDGLDPWRPETVTPERVGKLVEWAASGAAATAVAGAASKPTTAPVELSADDLAAAGREIDAMVNAPSDEAAAAARERLARVGRGLMADVRRRAAAATTDAARERLLALRYRLAARDGLTLAWPGGIERLAATAAGTRRAAADELVARAGAGDAPLLLELFADPDPLVREISLRGLGAAGKGDAGRALVGLLADPDLNVRAAVLKQVGENPSPALVQAVVDFVAKEPDVDLIVHGARVLRQSKTEPAVRGLLGLLGHVNWRVRAETAEALAEMTNQRSSSGINLTEERKADIYMAMVKLLDDPDGFVVSRAVNTLADADLAVAVDPMAKAAERHPELAGDLIKALARGRNTKAAAEKHVRAMCAHADDRVRSQAIGALCSMTHEVEKEVTAALKDPVVGVRMWAARSLFTMVGGMRPAEDTTVSYINGRPVVREPSGDDRGRWAADFRKGVGRPAWMAGVLPELRALTTQPGAETRLDGALAVLALDADDAKPLELIRGAVRAEPRLAAKAAEALPWLALGPRVELFKFCVAASTAEKDLRLTIGQMTTLKEPAAAPAIWELLTRPNGAELESTVYDGLQRMYFGGRYYSSDLPDADRKTVTEAAGPRAKAGGESQRRVALALLLRASLDEAVAAATAVRADPAAPAALKTDAFQVLLVASKKADGIAAAVAALSAAPPAKTTALPKKPSRRGGADGPPDERLLALRYLTTGSDDLQYFADAFYVSVNNPDLQSIRSFSSGQQIVIEAPPRIDPAVLRPLLKTGGETAALAGYLLALTGDRAGIDPLVAYWRSERTGDDRSRRLLYRAVTVVNAEDLAPLAEEIYKTFEKDSHSVGEFYWTIRGMTGERLLLLRKKIRDEVGMERLR